MKVRCIDNDKSCGLTLGKIYNTLDEQKGVFYKIINDFNKEQDYLVWRFKIIKEKPMRLVLKEFSNMDKLKQELKDKHIYLGKRKSDNDIAILFCCRDEVFKFSEENICTYTKESYKQTWTIIADVTDRVKISL